MHRLGALERYSNKIAPTSVPRHNDLAQGQHMSRFLLAHLVFSAVTSALMSSLVCGIATYRMVGLSGAFMQVWSGAWLTSWPIGFVVLVSIGPLVRRKVYDTCKCPMAVPTHSKQKID